MKTMTARAPKAPPPPATLWRQSQACLVALAIDRAWGAVENALEREPEAVLLSLRHLVSDGAVPSKRALVNVCRRRRAQNSVAAAAAASPADVDCWPDDMLAAIASRKLARPSKRPGAATAGYVAALTAAAALHERYSKREQQAAAAAPSMDALRKAKGAL